MMNTPELMTSYAELPLFSLLHLRVTPCNKKGGSNHLRLQVMEGQLLFPLQIFHIR
jgi:hypothetical protein